MNHPHFTKQETMVCEGLCKRYANSFYLAAQLFPRAARKSVFALYAFVRLAYEYVDNPLPGTDPLTELTTYEHNWQEALRLGRSDDVVFSALLKVVSTYHFPAAYFEHFIQAMKQDTYQKSYNSYEELEAYMYGSATVVGYGMAYIMGTTSEEALVSAKHLSEAFQLTNFLRDIEEDYVERARIYVPLKEMDAFNVSVNNVYEQQFSTEFGNYIKYQITRNRNLYRMAEAGIQNLPSAYQRPVALAAVYYERILDKLFDRDGNPFGKRISTTRAEKVLLGLRYLTKTL